MNQAKMTIQDDSHRDDSRGDSSYRFWTLGYSGVCTITDSHVETSIRNWHRQWSHSIPLHLVSRHASRLTVTPDSWWWLTIAASTVVGVGIWSMITPDQTGIPRFVAVLLLIASTALILFLLRFRRVVWYTFSTAIPGVTISFCRNAAPNPQFDQFAAELTLKATFQYPEELKK